MEQQIKEAPNQEAELEKEVSYHLVHIKDGLRGLLKLERISDEQLQEIFNILKLEV